MDSKLHKHIEGPSLEQLADVQEGRSPEIRQLYLDVHQLVLETVPGVAYSVDTHDGVIGYGSRQYGYGGWGMAALSASGKWVSLMFMRGLGLADPSGVLEGSGKNMRHVKLRSRDELDERRDALRGLLAGAAGVNQ